MQYAVFLNLFISCLVPTCVFVIPYERHFWWHLSSLFSSFWPSLFTTYSILSVENWFQSYKKNIRMKFTKTAAWWLEYFLLLCRMCDSVLAVGTHKPQISFWQLTFFMLFRMISKLGEDYFSVCPCYLRTSFEIVLWLWRCWVIRTCWPSLTLQPPVPSAAFAQATDYRLYTIEFSLLSWCWYNGTHDVEDKPSARNQTEQGYIF